MWKPIYSIKIHKFNIREIKIIWIMLAPEATCKKLLWITSSDQFYDWKVHRVCNFCNLTFLKILYSISWHVFKAWASSAKDSHNIFTHFLHIINPTHREQQLPLWTILLYWRRANLTKFFRSTSKCRIKSVATKSVHITFIHR